MTEIDGKRGYKSSSTYFQNETTSQAREPASYKYYSTIDHERAGKAAGKTGSAVERLLKPDRTPNVRADATQKRRVATQLATAK
jgi:hypothetical protein